MNAELNRLRWRCQRGMLELDHILHGFLERRYATAPEPVRAAFATLLEMEDADLFDLVMGRRAPATSEQAGLLALIRGPY
ncbi:succinate dehydrogenase assembly factor 2 [Parasulfuritortus cantonensis]|uniref:FAD assembly factor SdhE n=1 Tax=Parasulfuritortus cantonensis TaxID=2528202 RepID=A0A4V2NVD2_9PROT|nr:succinate dehydrogenase assembly factor 2 [Parasulfuritortus cantonensis]TCJ13026.1 succinate dehydrogenase assembly factor 2 [Parasulfuritortus cantonensis]